MVKGVLIIPQNQQCIKVWWPGHCWWRGVQRGKAELYLSFLQVKIALVKWGTSPLVSDFILVHCVFLFSAPFWLPPLTHFLFQYTVVHHWGSIVIFYCTTFWGWTLGWPLKKILISASSFEPGFRMGKTRPCEFCQIYRPISFTLPPILSA